MNDDAIVIDAYTSTWDDGVGSTGGGLEPGQAVHIPSDREPDGREYDAFVRRAREAGLVLQFDCPLSNEAIGEWDCYTLVRESAS